MPSKPIAIEYFIYSKSVLICSLYPDRVPIILLIPLYILLTPNNAIPHLATLLITLLILSFILPADFPTWSYTLLNPFALFNELLVCSIDCVISCCLFLFSPSELFICSTVLCCF